MCFYLQSLMSQEKDAVMQWIVGGTSFGKMLNHTESFLFGLHDKAPSVDCKRWIHSEAILVQKKLIHFSCVFTLKHQVE